MWTAAKNRFPPSSSMSSSQSARASKEPTKLPSSDPFGVVSNAFSFLCRRIVFAVPTLSKLMVCLLMIIVGSILKDLQLAPKVFLPSKRNILNVYFVKFGWAWSMVLLVAFIGLTTMIHNRCHYKLIVSHCIRLLVATGVWFVITTLFVGIEAVTGRCNDEELPNAPRHVCLRVGREWQEGHDISGHTFLLLYALLLIDEEVKMYDKVSKKVELDGAGGSSMMIRIFYIALAVLSVLWGFMLLSTALYFHHTWHKLVAAMLATFFWFITYRVWYPMKNILTPYAPGEGFVGATS